jgi:hypothetical protein
MPQSQQSRMAIAAPGLWTWKVMARNNDNEWQDRRQPGRVANNGDDTRPG